MHTRILAGRSAVSPTMDWGLAIAVVAGLVIGGLHYLRTTPEERRLQRARTQRIESSSTWRRGATLLALAPAPILVLGFIGPSILLAVGIAIGCALLVMGSIELIVAIRSEPKVSHRHGAEA